MNRMNSGSGSGIFLGKQLSKFPGGVRKEEQGAFSLFRIHVSNGVRRGVGIVDTTSVFGLWEGVGQWNHGL